MPKPARIKANMRTMYGGWQAMIVYAVRWEAEQTVATPRWPKWRWR